MRITKCVICGKDFKTNHNREKTCSLECHASNKVLLQKRLNREKGNEYRKEWLKKSPENKQKYNVIARRYREKNFNKKDVRMKTWRLPVEIKECQVCFSKEDLQNHHFEPYEINRFIRLCRKCHKLVGRYDKLKIKELEDVK